MLRCFACRAVGDPLAGSLEAAVWADALAGNLEQLHGFVHSPIALGGVRRERSLVVPGTCLASGDGCAGELSRGRFSGITNDFTQRGR